MSSVDYLTSSDVVALAGQHFVIAGDPLRSFRLPTSGVLVDEVQFAKSLLLAAIASNREKKCLSLESASHSLLGVPEKLKIILLLPSDEAEAYWPMGSLEEFFLSAIMGVHEHERMLHKVLETFPLRSGQIFSSRNICWLPYRGMFDRGVISAPYYEVYGEKVRTGSYDSNQELHMSNTKGKDAPPFEMLVSKVIAMLDTFQENDISLYQQVEQIITTGLSVSVPSMKNY